MALLELVSVVLRGIQLLFAIIEIGLTGHVASYADTPSQDSFLVFVSVWTILVIAFLLVAPRLLSRSSTIMLASLVLELLTMLFWFAGFVALAVFHRDLVNEANFFYAGGCSVLGNICGVIEAAVVFGALEWALFVVTLAFTIMEFLRSRGKGGAANTAV